MSKTYLKGLGMMVGMIFGAGIFALPYVFAKAGLFWGIADFIIAFIILLLFHFWYAEIAYYTKEKHRFTGYAEIFLGKKAKFLAFLSTLFSYYGSLLIYGILGGIFMANIFNFSVSQMAVAFFAVAGIMAFVSFEKIAVINFYLTVPLFGFVIYLFFIAFPSINADNFLNGANMFFNRNWFLPYGVWLFALSCTSVIPEVRDIFSKVSIIKFKRIIWLSISLSALFYFIFVIAVWGASGKFTTEDALSGLSGIIGRAGLVAGSLIGFLAVFTSYIALAADMKNVFIYDYKISAVKSWLFSVIPPLALFFLGVHDFVKTLGIIGSVGMGVFGIFVILIRHKMYKIISAGDREDIIREDEKIIKPRIFLEAIILIGISAGVIYELWKIFS